MKILLSHLEITMLMRSLSRSIGKTPKEEREAHRKLYDKMTEAWAASLPRHTVEKVGRALDRAIGR